MNFYNVPPFSGKNFQKNSEHAQNPCAICGKEVAFPFAHSAVVVDGGDKWAETEEELDSEDGNMGMFGIGPDCHRKHLVK